MIFKSKSLINLSLRGVTILLKLVLSLLLIRELSIEEYGSFGVFQSTVFIGTFILGLDFYNYNFREISNRDKRTLDFYLQHQFVFHLITYLILLPIFLLITNLEFLDIKYTLLFLLVLIGEHLSQEFYRLLILLGHSITGTLLLFIRSGLWVIAIYSVWFLDIINRDLKWVYLFWSISALLSIILALSKIKISFKNKIDFSWIKKGIVISLPFFIGTICYKLVEYSGRYFLQYYHSSHEVGVYTFFSSISNVLFVLVQTVVLIEIFPKLLSEKNKGYSSFRVILKKMEKQVIFYSIIGFVLSFVGIYPLLLFLGKEVLFEYFIAFVVLMLSAVFYCVSYIPHYALYSYGKDIKILNVNIISFVVNIVFSFLLVPKFSIYGAVIAQLLSFISFFILKLYFWKKAKIH